MDFSASTTFHTVTLLSDAHKVADSKGRVSLIDTLLSGQCRFLRRAESRVSPTVKVPLSTELNRTVCSMSFLCPRIWSLRDRSSDVLMGEKNVLL